MLSVEENARLTHVGPGTPMGELMRRYWHPVACTVELKENPTKAVRILGENLVLYKDRSGKLGLIQEACPHRRVNLLYGIPEEHGLRCPYHGWLFDETGKCLEQPAEAPDSTFKDRVTAVSYPVEELGGLIWAYLGPAPVPLLPRWDILVRDDIIRDIGVGLLPHNWLQGMENSMDPVHTEWLHGWFPKYVLEQRDKFGARARGVDTEQYECDLKAGKVQGPEMLGTRALDQRWEMDRQSKPSPRRHTKIGFDRFEHGLIKRRVVEGQTEENDDWRVGHPVVFPNILLVGSGNKWDFQIRVPVDDTHIIHYWYTAFLPPAGAKMPKQEEVPMFWVPTFDKDNGWVITDFTNGQDTMAWVTQGPIMERNLERLAESDKGIILFRRLLREQIKLVEDGGDPINTFRDPAKNVRIDLHHESRMAPVRSGSFAGTNTTRYSPRIDEWEKVFIDAQEAQAKV